MFDYFLRRVHFIFMFHRHGNFTKKKEKQLISLTVHYLSHTHLHSHTHSPHTSNALSNVPLMYITFRYPRQKSLHFYKYFERKSYKVLVGYTYSFDSVLISNILHEMSAFSLTCTHVILNFGRSCSRFHIHT